MSNQIALTSTTITAYNLSGSVATITFQFATGGSSSYSNLPNPNTPTAVYTVPAGSTYYSITYPLVNGNSYQYVTRDAAGSVIATVNQAFTNANNSSSYSVVLTAFTQPAVNSTVTATVNNTTWITPGSTVYIPNGGYYDVTSVPTSTTLTLLNTGMQENASSGTSIESGSILSPSGLAVKPYTPTTTTTADYTQPSAGSNVQISVVTTSLFAVGNSVYISGSTVRGGIYTIQSINSPTLMTIQRVSSGNTLAVTGTVPSGVSVTYYPATAMPMYVLSSQLFGSGIDGDLLIGDGTASFPSSANEKYYRNIAWGSTGSPPVYRLQYTRLYVSGVLDLTNCPVGGIVAWFGGTSPNATGTGQTLGIGSGNASSTIGFPPNSGAGGTGGTANGFSGSRCGDFQTTPCGGSAAGGVGGPGSSGSGANGGAASTGGATPPNATSFINVPSRYVDVLISGGGASVAKMISGASGNGGGGGGGNSTNQGGGGGAGGLSGGVVMIFANTIIRPASQRICITANGSIGGNGFTPTVGTNLGGGGGGSGGAGGIVYIYYNNIIGSVNNLGISANGGNGGNGGNGNGTGRGGGGGGSGDSGVIMMINGSSGAINSVLTVTAGGGPSPIGAGTTGSAGNTSPGQNVVYI